MILVVDASALVAVGLEEPERTQVLNCLRQADDVFITPINVTETGLALVLRHGRFRAEEFANWLTRLGVSERPVDGQNALRAYLQYGRGAHRAGLNLGDCFAYALAKSLDALYKGDDFALTDIRPALQPT